MLAYLNNQVQVQAQPVVDLGYTQRIRNAAHGVTEASKAFANTVAETLRQFQYHELAVSAVDTLESGLSYTATKFKDGVSVAALYATEGGKYAAGKGFEYTAWGAEYTAEKGKEASVFALKKTALLAETILTHGSELMRKSAEKLKAVNDPQPSQITQSEQAADDSVEKTDL